MRKRSGRHPAGRHLAGRSRRGRRTKLALATALTAAGLLSPFACNDTPGATVAPGNVLIDDSMQDAVAQVTQDIYQPPQGVGDAADGGYYDASTDGPYGSATYMDVQSPAAACSSCNCIGYCLENGTSLTFSGPVLSGYCSLSNTTAPAVGCNPLPAKCKATPTCACILDSVQPPLGCYPECTSSLGYLDVFCNVP